MNKRAQERNVYNTLFDLVLVAVAIIVLFGIYKGLIGVLQGRDSATLNNFQEVANQVKTMNVAEKKKIPVYVKEDWYIVGFKKDAKQTYVGGCNKGKMRDIIVKPDICYQDACLCLCEVGTQCNEKPVCKTFKDIDFTGGKSCSIALIPGGAKPQTVQLHKEKDTFAICVNEC